MARTSIDLEPLRRALVILRKTLDFWHAQAEGTRLKHHLRSAAIQSFEFTYELSVRLLRRVLIERATSAPGVADLSFNDLLRHAAAAGSATAFLADADALEPGMAARALHECQPL